MVRKYLLTENVLLFSNNYGWAFTQKPWTPENEIFTYVLLTFVLHILTVQYCFFFSTSVSVLIVSVVIYYGTCSILTVFSSFPIH